MISHEYKCIFIHIPKCAGTSIESVLGHYDAYSGRAGQDHRSIRMIEEPWMNKHLHTSKDNYIEVLRRLRHGFRKERNPRNQHAVTQEQYERYFKFTFVRNPWARAFSWYKNVMRDEIHRQGYRVRENVSLRDFFRKFAGRGMLRPQTYWITSFDGCIHLDYIGRFESLHRDFEEIVRRLSLPAFNLPKKGIGSGEDYREQYDHDSIDLVSHVYRSDIERFGYSFTS